MAQWRKTFFSLGGPENIADPNDQTLLDLMRIREARRGQDQAMARQNAALAEQQRQFDLSRGDSGEDRLFARRKDERDFRAQADDRLFARNTTTAQQQRQQTEADRNYQFQLQQAEERRRASERSASQQDRDLGLREQDLGYRRESDKQRMEREARERKEDLTARERERGEDRAERERTRLLDMAKEQRELGQRIAGQAQQDVVRRSYEEALLNSQRTREDTARSAQKEEFETAKKQEIDVRSAARAIQAASAAREALRGLTANPYSDPYVGGLASPQTDDFGYMSKLPVVGSLFSWADKDGLARPVNIGDYRKNPEVTPKEGFAKLRNAMVGLMSNAGAGDGGATQEDVEAVRSALVAALMGRADEIARESPGDVEALAGVLEIRDAIEAEAATLKKIARPSAPPKPYQPKAPNPIPRR